MKQRLLLAGVAAEQGRTSGHLFSRPRATMRVHFENSINRVVGQSFVCLFVTLYSTGGGFHPQHR